ncbi:hypothetical protein ZWY2020_041358 [Hordeum vulgare]|nr:hypothetical protein ZWY2020_041358 [Hordeum vulgare]
MRAGAGASGTTADELHGGGTLTSSPKSQDIMADVQLGCYTIKSHGAKIARLHMMELADHVLISSGDVSQMERIFMIMSLLVFFAMERTVSSRKVTRASQVDTHHGCGLTLHNTLQLAEAGIAANSFSMQPTEETVEEGQGQVGSLERRPKT